MVVLTIVVLAADTVTMLCAFQSGIEALTILFLALGFLAIAFSLRNEGFHSLKCPGFSEVRHLLGEMDFVLVAEAVLTGYADAVWPTNLSSCETFTV